MNANQNKGNMSTINKVSDAEYTKLERAVTKLLKSLKPTIADDYRATDDPDDNTPGMCVTVGATPNEDGCLTWSYQTGDNSYSGGCYAHSHWGVGYLYRKSKSASLASEIVGEIAESISQMDSQ